MQTQSKNKRKFSKPKSKKGSFLIKRTFSAKIVHLAPSGFLPRNTKGIELGRLLSPKDFCWIYCSSVSFERPATPRCIIDLKSFLSNILFTVRRLFIFFAWHFYIHFCLTTLIFFLPFLYFPFHLFQRLNLIELSVWNDENM